MSKQYVVNTARGTAIDSRLVSLLIAVCVACTVAITERAVADGACCAYDHTCTMEPLAACVETGSAYLGDTSNCTGDPCADIGCDADFQLDVLGRIIDPEDFATDDYLDIVSAAVTQTGFDVTFWIQTRGNIPTTATGPVDEIVLLWLIDADRDPATGQPHGDVGSEFNVRVQITPGSVNGFVDVTGAAPGGGGGTVVIENNRVQVTVSLSQLADLLRFTWRSDAFAVVNGECCSATNGETPVGAAIACGLRVGGACCLPDASCDEGMLLIDCIIQSGAWGGPGVVCGDSFCDMDSDGDGVFDFEDVCCTTPVGLAVDEHGRPRGDLDEDCDVDLQDAAILHANLSGPLPHDEPCVPRCGNGVIEDDEQCDPPDNQLCGVDCRFRLPPFLCGNGIIEPTEACDPPDGVICDENCQLIGGDLVNDFCENSLAVYDGTQSFTNVGATTDGPPACDFFGNSQIDSDVWFCYSATCDELVTVSLCGSLYDTKLAVYNGCECPTGDQAWIACSDDDCGAGVESRGTFPATNGQDYMIRAGGFAGGQNEQGEGTLTIFCESDPDHGLATCRETSGDCFSANGSPGCDIVDVCVTTCIADPYCCDTDWDALCATKADGIANGFDACGAGNGSCFIPDGTAGCDDTACCQSVCESDPFCCLTEWDQVCADSVPNRCGIFEACQNNRGSCATVHATAGCSDEPCCTDVCTVDPLCCSDTWDEVCVSLASESCTP